MGKKIYSVIISPVKITEAESAPTLQIQVWVEKGHSRWNMKFDKLGFQTFFFSHA